MMPLYYRQIINTPYIVVFIDVFVFGTHIVCYRLVAKEPNMEQERKYGHPNPDRLWSPA